MLYCWPSSIAERTAVLFGCGKRETEDGRSKLHFAVKKNLRLFGCLGFCLRFKQVVTKTVPSRKLTCPLKIDGWKM